MGLTFSFVRRWWRQTGQCWQQEHAHQNRRHAFQFIYFAKAINLPIDLVLLVAIGSVRSPLSVHRRLMFSKDDDGCCRWFSAKNYTKFVYSWNNQCNRLILTINRMMSTTPAKSVIIQCCLRCGYFAGEFGFYLRLIRYCRWFFPAEMYLAPTPLSDTKALSFYSAHRNQSAVFPTKSIITVTNALSLTKLNICGWCDDANNIETNWMGFLAEECRTHWLPFYSHPSLHHLTTTQSNVYLYVRRHGTIHWNWHTRFSLSAKKQTTVVSVC